MKIEVSLHREHLLSFMRNAGYVPDGRAPNGELRFYRLFGRQRYPRFHIYAREESDRAILNLHLDQKQPSYRGTSAHAGEYDGPIVEREAARIAGLANGMVS